VASKKANTACQLIRNMGVDLRKDWYQLRSSDVDKVLAVAGLYKYHKPKTASGSRGGAFFQFMQRVYYGRV